MIPAKKNRLVGGLLAWDAERRLRRSFAATRVFGLAGLATELARGPVLLVANHTAWWDPIVAIALSMRVLRADAFALMDAKNLRRFPFFSSVGAFGVDLADAADGARALRYAAKLLSAPGRLLWIFPQGREVPLSSRPLEFKGGSAELARLAKGARVVPAALRYEMGATEKPTAYVSFGAALAFDRSASVAALRDAQAEAVTAELGRIERFLLGEVGAGEGPEALFSRTERPGLAVRALARLTAPSVGRGEAHGSPSS